MQERKPSKPWSVTKKTSKGVLPATAFRSEEAAYEAVTLGRLGAEKGATDVVAATVHHWEDGRWRRYEQVAYPQHPDRLAQRYEDAKKEHELRPDMPGAYEAMGATWDVMVDKVEELQHDIDTCDCRSCGLYRAGTGEDRTYG